MLDLATQVAVWRAAVLNLRAAALRRGEKASHFAKAAGIAPNALLRLQRAVSRSGFCGLMPSYPGRSAHAAKLADRGIPPRLLEIARRVYRQSAASPNQAWLAIANDPETPPWLRKRLRRRRIQLPPSLRRAVMLGSGERKVGG